MTAATMSQRYVVLDDFLDPDQQHYQSDVSGLARRPQQKARARGCELSTDRPTTTSQQFRELFDQPSESDHQHRLAEVELFLAMKPKSQRALRVRVIRREKWTPNPLIDEVGD